MKKFSLAPIGGCRTDGTERALYDLYTTPTWAVEELLRHEEFSHHVWECACGLDDISRALEAAGYCVRRSDIVARKKGQEQIDFLSSTNSEPFDGDIISNVPYTLGLQFVQKALSLVTNGHKVAMLFPLGFLTSKKRFDTLFQATPPKTLYIFPRRVSCAKYGDKGKGGCIDFAWFVWEKGCNDAPRISWLSSEESEYQHHLAISA